jgi:hypothetical protein
LKSISFRFHSIFLETTRFLHYLVCSEECESSEIKKD